jgi:hypothetical protein
MASILPPQAAWLQVCGDAKLSFKSQNQEIFNMQKYDFAQYINPKLSKADQT